MSKTVGEPVFCVAPQCVLFFFLLLSHDRVRVHTCICPASWSAVTLACAFRARYTIAALPSMLRWRGEEGIATRIRVRVLGVMRMEGLLVLGDSCSRRRVALEWLRLRRRWRWRRARLMVVGIVHQGAFGGSSEGMGLASVHVLDGGVQCARW